MTRLPSIILLTTLSLAACTQAAREGIARSWCESAKNCTVYDENGKETRKRDLCHGNRNCRNDQGPSHK